MDESMWAVGEGRGHGIRGEGGRNRVGSQWVSV